MQDKFSEIFRIMMTAAIVGASGYSGAELMRILSRRDDVVIEKVFAASAAGQRVDALYPSFAGKLGLTFEPYTEQVLGDVDVVFLALPSGQAMTIVPGLLGRVQKVIDLGGDFRLPSAELYEQYYRRRHAAPELLGEAVYGLPELNRSAIANARLIANPGCYPTGALLGLIPALDHGIIAPESIVINSLSGVSGAGRSASLELSFCEVNENVRAYKVGNHQHIPEIQMVLDRVSAKPVTMTFIPHLVPVNRGIYSTLTATLNIQISSDDLRSLYESFYAKSPFIRVKRQVPQLSDVVGTNFCDIAVMAEERTHRIIITTVIDNLIKGAAGQAIQNMNILFGLPEQQGLS